MQLDTKDSISKIVLWIVEKPEQKWAELTKDMRIVKTE